MLYLSTRLALVIIMTRLALVIIMDVFIKTFNRDIFVQEFEQVKYSIGCNDFTYITSWRSEPTNEKIVYSDSQSQKCVFYVLKFSKSANMIIKQNSQKLYFGIKIHRS